MTNTITKNSSTDYFVHTEIDINAPVETVWDILTDFEKMPEWSSTFQGIQGEFKKEAQIASIYKGPLGKEMRIEHPLVSLIDGHEFAWSSEVALGIIDHHIFRVERIDDARTRFVQTDQPNGSAMRVLGPLVARIFKNMYETFNRELKTRAESR